MTQPGFIEGHFYKRDEIHNQIGGSKETYFPTLEGKVVCACLRQDLNPRAPEVILVGNKPNVVKAAIILSTQSGLIPVFIKDCPNSWRFEGMYSVDGYKTDAATIQKELINSGRENINGVLYLKKHIGLK